MNRRVPRRVGFVAIGIDGEATAVACPDAGLSTELTQVHSAVGPMGRRLGRSSRRSVAAALSKHRHGTEQYHEKDPAMFHLHTKFDASFVSPEPLYFAVWG